MRIFMILPVLLLSVHSTFAVWTLKTMATEYIPADYINGGEAQFPYDGGAVNSVTYDPEFSFAYVAGDKWIQIVDFSKFRQPHIVHKMRTTEPITDIAQCDYVVAWITRGASITEPGTLHVWDGYGRVTKKWNLLCTAQVGSNPVSLKFFNKCSTIVIANKGTAGTNPNSGAFENPEGTISVVRLTWNKKQGGGTGGPGGPGGPGQRPPPPAPGGPNQPQCAPKAPISMTVRTLDFTRFNDPLYEPFLAGVRRPYDGSLDQSTPTFSQAMEPTYVTGDPTYNSAYISLRENNAVVQVNLDPGNETITAINPMGTKSWFQYNLDATNAPQPGVSFGRYDIQSLRQPNAIEPFEVRTQWSLDTFLFTADEGAPTTYNHEATKWSDAVPGAQLTSPPQRLELDLQSPERLGKLMVSKYDGLIDPADPQSGYESAAFFGGRGISMFRFNESSSDLNLIWDSGDAIASAVSEFYPKVFNSRTSTPDSQSHGQASNADLASAWRGAQCKSLQVGNIDPGQSNTHLVFVGVDGPSVIGIFSVSTNGSYPMFESVYRNGYAHVDKRFSIIMEKPNRVLGKSGDIDPAKLQFIPSSTTPDQYNYLMAIGKKSGTVTLYRVLNEPRQIMMNRLRKESNAATAINRSIPAIVASLLFAAIMRQL